MKALVVYESMFGNTERVARAIGLGLSASVEVEVCSVAEAPDSLPADLSLLVVGGPTHAFSMSRRRTRLDAVQQGGHGDASSGLREWLSTVAPPEGDLHLTTFDTRVGGARHLPGSASTSAARLARRRGFPHVANGGSFYGQGVTGPLEVGEVERATAWGRCLGSQPRSPRRSRRHEAARWLARI